MRSFLVTVALLFLACCQKADSWGNEHGHEDYYSRPHKSKTFRLPSGQTYSIKNPHKSISSPCYPGAKVKEIKHRGFYKREYNMVVNEFTDSNMDPTKTFEITKVEKIFNGCWLQRYNYRQNQIKDELTSDEDINEIMLFHGTSGEVDGKTGAQIVAQKGFNMAFGKKGDDFGAGLYFSNHSSMANEKSKTNSQGLKEMILARVTLGEMHMAPAKKKFAHSPPGTQSVVKDDIFVIYRAEQAYPDYIITYEEV